MKILLNGASWGCLFYIGVYKAIIERKLEIEELYGNSAGALIGLCIVLEKTLEEALQIYNDLAENANKNGVIGKMTKYHNMALDRLLVNNDDYKKVNGKLKVGITTKKKHIWVDNFKSNEELRHALHCSFYVPLYCSYYAVYLNEQVLDGGFGCQLNDLPANVIKIGMESFFDIASNITTKECTFPILPGTKYDEIIKNGYNKMLNYKIPEPTPVSFLHLNHRQLRFLAHLSNLIHHRKY